METALDATDMGADLLDVLITPEQLQARIAELAARIDADYAGRELILVDGSGYIFRAFFALPPENFSTTTGQPTTAVFGFTSMLINVLADEQPTHVAVAFDRAEGPKELEAIEGGHFGLLYEPGPVFDRVSQRERDFLVKHLA